MTPAVCADQAPVPPPSYHRTMATALHLDALTLVIRSHLLQMCRLAVQLAQRQCPPPLPAGPGRAPRVYTEETLLLLVLLRTLWRLSYQELHDWLCACPALALACRLLRGQGRVGETHQQRAVLRSRLGLLPPTAPACLRLVGGGDAGRAHLCGRLGRRLGRLASGTPRTHPLIEARPGPCLGRHRGM